MRNIKSHISASNLKKLNQNLVKKPESPCNCENEERQCPVNGNCKLDNVVYEAKVKSRNATKTYIGMTSRPFIERWKEHRGNIRHKHQNGTKLSKFVWKQKDFGEQIDIADIE